MGYTEYMYYGIIFANRAFRVFEDLFVGWDRDDIRDAVSQYVEHEYGIEDIVHSDYHGSLDGYIAFGINVNELSVEEFVPKITVSFMKLMDDLNVKPVFTHTDQPSLTFDKNCQVYKNLSIYLSNCH